MRIRRITRILSADLSCKIITYGLDHEAQYQFHDITYDKYGHASFTVLKDGRKTEVLSEVPGSHNVSNALAAIALAELLRFRMMSLSKDLAVSQEQIAVSSIKAK